MENYTLEIALNLISLGEPELYERAEKGEIENLPGVDLEYEKPQKARLVFKPQENEINIDRILDYLSSNKIFPII